MVSRPALAALLPLLAATALRADDLGGATVKGSHGRVPRFVLDSWIPGQPSAFRFVDLPPGPAVGVGLLSNKRASIGLPGVGTLVIDVTSPAFVAFPMQNALPIPKLPATLNGVALFFQGAYVDKGRVLLTDGTRADVFTPAVMVGNQRQSANSISVIDPTSRSVVQRLTNSENGYITFSSDRRWAYVCEPGSRRNRVVFYDLSRRPITVRGTAPVSGGIRYGCAVTRDGKRIYAPVHDGISVIDSDPNSRSFMKELRKIPTKITGNSGTIFTGPLDVAVTPNGRKLYVAYGENLAFPAKSHVGMIDLTKASFPETLIPITTGGTFRISAAFEFATHPRIKMSPDGLYAYVCEWGLDPTTLGQFVRGFTQGGLVKVIFTPTDRELTAIPTKGYQASELAADRMGRNVWVAQIGPGGFGEVLRIDVDRRSQTRFKARPPIRVHAVPYRTGAGPIGIDTTPDGSQVFVSVSEDGSHRKPLVITVDSRQNRVTGSPIVVESLCSTVRVQQR